MRWIGRCNLSCRNWLHIAKLFEDNFSPAKASLALGLAYNTVLRAFMVLRLAILFSLDDGGEFCERAGVTIDTLLATKARRPEARFSRASKVFEIQETGGRVRVRALPRLSPTKVLKSAVATTRAGNLIVAISARGRKRLFLDFPPCRESRNSRRLQHMQALLPGELDEFLKDIIFQFIARRSVSAKSLPLYLKEFEFRFNNPKADLFPILIERLCRRIEF